MSSSCERVITFLFVFVLCIDLVYCQTLTLTNQNLEFIPAQSSEDTTTTVLDLRYNNIAIVDPEHCKNYTILNELRLSYNKLIEFPDVTPLADTLLRLYLDRNNIALINAALLNPLKNMLFLDLSYNFAIPAFPNGLVQNMALQTLYLRYNILTEMPVMDGICPALSFMNLWKNNIRYINPSNLVNCKNLANIYLSFNQLQEFPDLTPIGNSLQYLYLEGNQISFVNQTLLEGLHNLQYLYLSNNLLDRTTFPTDIVHPNLRTLELYMNRFDEAPVFEVAGQLTYLGIGNNISHIPSSYWANFTSLETLNLSNNKFKTNPNLEPLSGTLRVLRMYNNQMTNITDEYINNLTNLYQLDVGWNLLDTIPNVAGPGNTLRYLYMSNNKFTSLPNISEIGKSLSYLYLYQNSISHICPSDILNIPSSCTIDLQYNPVTTVNFPHSNVYTPGTIRFDSTFFDNAPICAVMEVKRLYEKGHYIQQSYSTVNVTQLIMDKRHADAVNATCPSDSVWSEWTYCTTCGVQKRTRTCGDPICGNGTWYCGTEVIECECQSTPDVTRQTTDFVTTEIDTVRTTVGTSSITTNDTISSTLVETTDFLTLDTTVELILIEESDVYDMIQKLPVLVVNHGDYDMANLSSTTTNSNQFTVPSLSKSEHVSENITDLMEEAKRPVEAPAAQFIGSSAVVFVITLLVLIILLDVPVIYKQIKSCCRKLKPDKKVT